MNHITLIGNLVRDPDLKYTQAGTAVVSATVAVNRRKKDGTDRVSFVDLTIWDKRGEAFANYHV